MLLKRGLLFAIISLCSVDILSAAVVNPPAAPIRPVTDNYFDTQVTDPYRWMETPNSPELAE